MKNEEIPEKFYKFKIIHKWINFLNDKKINPLNLSINFIKKYNFYENVVIGFDNYLNFKEVLNIYTKNKLDITMNKHMSKFKTDSKLINPSNW